MPELTLNQQAAEILEAAALVVSLPDWHARDNMALSSHGYIVDIASAEACRFCAVGAIQAAALKGLGSRRALTVALSFAAQQLPVWVGKVLNKQWSIQQKITYYNDAIAENHAQVAETLWKAAQHARASN